ncbi:NAC domain-containing protein 55-like [Sesamum indicum]|uniref:NAC domain-containing protein 55-like n=1 Tax=Sesamum indicum TaxID=4182 RepID=A0A8M8V2B9_SESIN|nr:NAC domain-containing protein 55-like [Sesamum indicum]
MMIIPPGFHFAPTDQELITFYLSRKAMGLHLPWSPVLEKTIYGEKADPWDVFADVPWDTSVSTGEGKGCKNVKSVIYVFTKLSKVNGKTRIARTAGCGTWDGQTGGREIYNNSRQLIGLMKMFSFTVKKSPRDGRKQRDHWIMHEYSLAGVSLNCELPYKDYVICRITRSSKESVRGECSSLSTCGENQLSNDNELWKKRSAAQPQEVTSQKKQKVDSTSLHVLEERSTTYVGPSGDNFAWTPDFGYANAGAPQQLPMPVDGCLMPQHDQLDGQDCSYQEDDSLLDLLLELEDKDGSLFDFHLDDEDASGSLFDFHLDDEDASGSLFDFHFDDEDASGSLFDLSS